MTSQLEESQRGKTDALAKMRAKRQRRLKRKRRNAEPLHESCIAYTARHIHWDCALAIKAVPVVNVGGVAWRTAWLVAVALLRAIGHALHKEDAHRSIYLTQAVEAAWQRWKRDIYASQIFHGFIEDERNAVLKNYQFWNERKVYPLEKKEVTEIGQHLVVVGGQAVAPDAALRLAWNWWKVEITRIQGHAADLRQADLQRLNLDPAVGGCDRARGGGLVRP